MIPGFEEVTAELTDAEKAVAQKIGESLRSRIGVDSAIKSQKLSKIYTTPDLELTGARIRKIIHYLRTTNTVERLVASSKGYYVSEDAFELKNYIAGLRGRANSINMVADILEQQAVGFKDPLLKDFINGQF